MLWLYFFQIQFMSLSWAGYSFYFMVASLPLLMFSCIKKSYDFLFLGSFCLLCVLLSMQVMLHGEHWWQGAIFSLLCLFLMFLVYRGLFTARKSASRFLKEICESSDTSQLALPVVRERREFLDSLNRMGMHLKEKEALNQYVSPEVWKEIHRGGETSKAARERKVLSLAICFHPVDSLEQLKFAESMQSVFSAMAEKHKAFLNVFRKDNAEILFFPDSMTADRDAVTCMEKILDLRDHCEVKHCSCVLRMATVKAGFVVLPGGVRYSAFGNELKEDHRFLFGRSSQEGVFAFIHSSFKFVGERYFHLQEVDEKYTVICGKKDIEWHYSKLKSARVEERLTAIRVLESYRYEKGIELIINALDDVSPRVRIAAAQALGMMITKKTENLVGESLLKSLESEWNHDARATIVMALGNMRRKEFVAPLFEMLHDENPRVRANSIEAMAKSMHPRKILKHLEGKLTDPNNRARANAALAVWLVGQVKGFDELLLMGRADDILMSCSGLYGIGEIFTEQNLSVFARFHHDLPGFYLNEKNSLFQAAFDLCLEKLWSDEPLIERNSIIALKKMQNREAVPHLIKKYDNSSEKLIHTMVLEALEECGETALVSQLRQRAMEAS
jgi:HEAT repeat protein